MTRPGIGRELQPARVGMQVNPRTLSTSAARALEAALRTRTTGKVRFDDGARALYATDASNYRQVPIGVVLHLTELVRNGLGRMA